MLDCALCAAHDASFALFDGHTPPADDFHPQLGDIYRPDGGATIVLTAHGVGRGEVALSLHGPGISGRRGLQLAGVHARWFERRENWVAEFPMGIDLIVCDETCVTAFPRTTSIDLIGATTS
jgi:alpha-D-ribose 1-methylphosphonate 5-triphosphate synthase subunit PhnH